MSKAKNRNSNNIIEYTEKHHIIPKCLGGTNIPDNIVILTGREHYIAHGILVKIYKNNKQLNWKLISAFRYMTVHNTKQRSGNRDYEWMRKLYSENHPCKRPEIRKKISLALSGRTYENTDWIIPTIKCECKCGCGKTFIKKINNKQVFLNYKHNNQARRGIPLSDNTKLKQSNSAKIRLSKLSKEELAQRNKNSWLSCDNIKRGKAISAGKKGKSTNQYEIMKQRYISMNDEEILEYIKNKTISGQRKILTLRRNWLNGIN